MIRAICSVVLAALVSLTGPDMASAEGLRVSPVLLDITAPGATSTLTLRNEGGMAITVQTRSFRWTQQGGQEQLARTKDVVVSPPSTRLEPGATQTIRVIRTSKAPVTIEEAYRVIVNEVPDQSRLRSGVAFATELRIPVFFTPRGATSPDVAWSLQNAGNATVLVAQNRGGTRLRIADLRLDGGKVSRPGLLGYVLAGASMQWPVAAAGRFGGGTQMQAATSLGALDVRIGGR